MEEDPFVATAMEAAKEVLAPPLSIERGAALLYQVTVNNRLEIGVDPKKPVRGQSAFQTDLCVFETLDGDTKIPRVVLEFKPRISTHDVLSYSAKARKHKQIYPYVRYGIVIGSEEKVPGRFFTHNEALDFCVATATYKAHRLHEIIARLLRAEVQASRQLEKVAFGMAAVHVFRSDIVLDEGIGKVT
ncbi:MAG TPA: hypothetical protein VFE23_21680 [Usitatibacter sp.]|jgi:hypothetical protein|nr:hypothetical protein [Usitatibacter sp.]